MSLWRPLIRWARANLQMELKTIFQQIRQTVIFVTHDLAEAAWLGDQIVLLREGQVVQSGHLRRHAARANQQPVLCRNCINAQRKLAPARKAMFAFFTGLLLASAAVGSSTAPSTGCHRGPGNSPTHMFWPISPSLPSKGPAIRRNTARVWGVPSSSSGKRYWKVRSPVTLNTPHDS